MKTDYIALIPTRNRYEHCLRAVRSVLAQSVPPSEVVVIDDASTDPRYEWLEEIVGDARMTMLREPVCSQQVTRAGFAVGHVRNVGLAYIKRLEFDGWIAFLDDDDEWMPDKMRCQFDVAKAYGDVMVFCSNAYNRSPTGLICGYHHGDHGRKLNGCHDVTKALRELNPVINSTAIIHADVAAKVGKQAATGFGEDWDYWRRAAILSPVFRLDEPLAFYTVGNHKEYEL